MICCIGDSFTSGEDLPRFVSSNYNTPNAWPYLLGQKLNHDVVNLGRGGCGNTRIIKKTIDKVLEGNLDLLVVAWTNPARQEFCDEHGLYDLWPGRDVSRVYSVNYRHELSKLLTASFFDSQPLYFYLQWLRQVILLQSFLSTRQQKFIMLSSFETEWLYKDFKTNAKVLKLINEIDHSTFLGFPGESMSVWTDGLPRGATGHFLEEGHKIVAEKIYERIRHFGWFS